MKNVLIVILITFVLGTHSLKAQDEDAAGWYADGVKVTSINCYGFKNLQLVLPYNSEWESYTKISVKIYAGGLTEESGGVKYLSVSSLGGFIKGKYFVYNMFVPGDKPHDDGIQMESSREEQGMVSIKYNHRASDEYNIYRWGLKYQRSTKKVDSGPTNDRVLYFQLFGLTQTGINEKFDNVCNCIKKEPVYTSAKLCKKYKITFTNREIVGKKVLTDESAFTTQCNYDGQKLDLGTSDKTKKSPNENTNKKTPTDTKKDSKNKKEEEDDDKDGDD